METFDASRVVQNRPWFERALDTIAPSYALKRLQAHVQRELFSYNASVTNRLYAPKTYGQPSESPRTTRDRVVMMWEARDLVENVPQAREISRKFGNYLTPHEYSPTTNDREYNGIVSDYFHEWCKKADVTGRHSFKKLVQIAAEERPVDGDCGFIIRRMDGELKLQLVPATRIGNPNAIGAEGPNYYQGIITDDFGKPVAYRIYRIDRNGVYFDAEDVAAMQFCHYFDPFRSDQMRGVSDFHAAIKTTRMLYEILEAEKAGVRFASQQAALIFNDRSSANPRNLFQPSPNQILPNGSNQNNEFSEIGAIKYLGQTDRVELMPSRPSQAFTGFVQHLMHEIAIAVGIPEGVLFGTQDYKGPSVRAEFAAADRVFSRHQGILTDKVLDPIKNAVILDAIAQEFIPPPPMQAGETMVQALKRATCGEWRFPAKLSIDVGRESAANMNENRQGAKSLQEIAGEEGTDAFSRLEQIAIEAAYVKELAKKYEVPETAIRLTTNQLPSTPSAASAAGESVGIAAADAQAASRGQSAPSLPDQSGDPATASDITQNDANIIAINLFDDGYVPNESMASSAKTALDIRQGKAAYDRGMTSVGLARARDIAAKKTVSEETVRRMKAYFDRHAKAKESGSWSTNDKNWQAWNGWGGDAGRAWANAIVERLDQGNQQEVPKIALANQIEVESAIRNLPAEQWLAAIEKARSDMNAKNAGETKNLAEGDACPVETQDIAANLANRSKAVEVAHYGPANPLEPNDEYWAAKAATFRTTPDQAKTMRCGGCAAFNVSPRIKNCINKGIGSDAAEVEQAGELGFCEFFDFKCAAKRTCDAWVVGGPIKTETAVTK